jgi:hypothetical protein
MFTSFTSWLYVINPLPALTLKSARILIPPCRAKRSKALFHQALVGAAQYER